MADGGGESSSADAAQAMTAAAQREKIEELQRQQKEMTDEKKRLELALQVANKEEKRAVQDVKELEVSGMEFDEQLSLLKDRVAAVTSELSQLKLNKALEDALQEPDDGLNEQDPNLEIATFREMAPTINKAFGKALKARLADPAFVEKLSDTNTASRPEFCRVLWQGESAEWKVHDPRDGTEVTFGALLQDVCRYWGLHYADMCFVDAGGAAWPLELYAWDELGPTGDVSVQLARRPRTEQLDVLEYAYEDDESTLPLAVQRKLDRERRAKQLERHTKESIRKQKARERQDVINQLIFYVLQMLLYFWVLDARRNVRHAFLLTDAVRTAFVDEEFGDYNEKTFDDIRTYEEFYDWAKGPFTEGLLPAEYYDGSEIPADRKRVMYYNRVVGGLRMRQVRVTPNENCNIASNVITTFTASTGPDAGRERIRKYVDKCYSNYKKGTSWSRRPFSVMAQTTTNSTGPVECRQYHKIANTYDETTGRYGYTDPRKLSEYDTYERCLGKAYWPVDELVDPATGETNVSDPLLLAFTWRSDAENDLANYQTRSRFGGFYDGSGFVYDLTNLTTDSLVEAFEFLDENTWLDRQTRALFMTLIVYNANFNLYSVLNFSLELSLAGTIVPKYNLQTVKMDLIWSFRDTTKDLVYFVIEAVMYAGMAYYLFNEFRELYSIYSATGSILGYFKDFWNVVDWCLILLSFFALSMRISFVLSDKVRSFDPFATKYVEITGPAGQYNNSFAFDAIAASFGIFKILRFFDLQRNLLILRTSIERGVADLVNFTVVLLLIMFGFAFSGMNIFGQENEEYVDIMTSFITLFLTVLGEFDFEKMIRVDFAFGYVFFTFYQLLVFLVMINIFLAILNDAYIAIKEKFDAEELEEGPPPLTLRQRVQKFRLWLRQRELDNRIEGLRKQQRLRELGERRAARKVEEARRRTLKAMGMDSGPAKVAGRGGDGSALMRTEEL